KLLEQLSNGRSMPCLLL
ncbi:unnamed protein product, partial [Allacma fusca]